MAAFAPYRAALALAVAASQLGAAAGGHADPLGDRASLRGRASLGVGRVASRHEDLTSHHAYLDSIVSSTKSWIEGGTAAFPREVQAMSQAAAGNIQTVCQTGFNGGHSALTFLHHPNVRHVYSFDIGEHDYAHQAAKWIDQQFPGRHTVTWGDSTKTIPQFARDNPQVKCDLVLVDGGHDLEVATEDLMNFRPMATPSAHTLMMDDVHCTKFDCDGPSKAWRKMIDTGKVHETSFEATPDTVHGWAFGKYL